MTAPAWRTANDCVRFALELIAVAALGAWGWHAATGWLAVVLAGAAPLAAMTVWGRYVAPRAPRYLNRPGRLIVEGGVFGAAALALAAGGHPAAAIAFALVAGVNTVVVHACRLDERARAAAVGPAADAAVMVP